MNFVDLMNCDPDMDRVDKAEALVVGERGSLRSSTSIDDFNAYWEAIVVAYFTLPGEPTLGQWRDPDGRLWTPNYINGSWFVYAGVEAMAGPFGNRHDATAHIGEVATMMERNV